ncbi:BREX-6 system BrxE protein [bacterium]|nr:BREX-6 system BrxE protein [bacterium]
MTKWTTEILDIILGLQFRVAWAGEALCDPPRLRWWRTDLVDPMSGGDFLRRLAPRTHRWASLEAVREAARLTDLKSRKLLADPDSARTLFSWGFELDEMLADRIREQKWALSPAPAMGEFDRTRLEAEFKALAPEASYNIQASGRQMRGPLPEDPAQAARLLVAALTPLGDAYPTPFFRISTT